jgi:hypothetical protein
MDLYDNSPAACAVREVAVSGRLWVLHREDRQGKPQREDYPLW